jgi:hypothetical protein
MSNEREGGSIEPYPEASIQDYGRSGVDAALAAIPVVGGSLQVLIDLVIAPSLAQRRDRWFTLLGQVVDDLRQRVEGFQIDSLSSNEAFVTAVAEASRIAVGTHIEEKLRMLKNCLVNLVIDDFGGDFMTMQMFRFVDELAPQHFVVLGYLSSPGEWFDSHNIPRPNLTMGSQQHLLGQARVPVGGAVLQIVLKDLDDRGLANTRSMTTTLSGSGLWQGLSSSLGQDLLRFVRES